MFRRETAGATVDAVPRYLVECYLVDSGAALDEARRCARRTAELGDGIDYVRTTFLPGDQTLFHLFVAPSAAVLGDAGRQAALRIDRIVEAIEGSDEP